MNQYGCVKHINMRETTPNHGFSLMNNSNQPVDYCLSAS